MDVSEILRVLESFAEHEVEYILVGGVALNLHGIGRPTEDIDFFIRPTPDNVSRIKQALRAVYDDDSIEEISADDLSGKYPTVRYGPPHGAFYIDLISRLGEFASFEDLKAEDADFRGIAVRLATPETLYWLKKGTVRSRDRADAEALREKFNIKDQDDR